MHCAEPRHYRSLRRDCKPPRTRKPPFAPVAFRSGGRGQKKVKKVAFEGARLIIQDPDPEPDASVEELSLHVLDIAENSVRAGAKNVSIAIRRDEEEGFLVIEVQDDGRGMTEEEQKAVFDPFFTRRTERRVGLGLPFLAQAAEACEGGVDLCSAPGRGTRVRARFRLGHIDLQPMGDLAETVTALLAGWPDRNFRFRYARGAEAFELDTEEIRRHLGDVPLCDPTVLTFLRRSMREGMREVDRRP